VGGGEGKERWPLRQQQRRGSNNQNKIGRVNKKKDKAERTN
jgi:hypothetical protein